MPPASQVSYVLVTRYVTQSRGAFKSSFTVDTYPTFQQAKAAMLGADLQAMAKNYRTRKDETLVDVRLEISRRSAKGEKRITLRSLGTKPWRYS